MKKRLLSILLALCMVLALLSGTAGAASVPTSGTCGPNLRWSLGADGVMTISGTGPMDDFRYVSGVLDDGRIITTAPWSVLVVKSIVIQNGVTSIGNYAFAGLRNVSSLSIPASVTSIGENVFMACPVATINVDTRNAYYRSTDGVLYNKDMTTLVFYPNGKSNTSFSIPSSVKTIADNAFCAGYWGDAVHLGGYWAKSNLTSVTIPNSVTKIGCGAFSYCTKLKSITIPDGVTMIDDRTFYICTSLTNVSIPKTVNKIGAYAFGGCEQLADISYSGDLSQWRSISIGENNDPLTSANIHYNSGGTTSNKLTAQFCNGLGSNATIDVSQPISVTWNAIDGASSYYVDYNGMCTDLISGDTYYMSYSFTKLVPGIYDIKVVALVGGDLITSNALTLTVTPCVHLVESLNLSVDESKRIDYEPSAADFSLTSSDTSVITISGGTVTAVGDGTATISATATMNGATTTKSCTVTVSSVRIADYFKTEAKNWAQANTNGAYIMKNPANIAVSQRAAFVRELTKNTLGDYSGASSINAKLEQLLFTSTYRPQAFGGNDAEIRGWPWKNKQASGNFISAAKSGLGQDVRWENARQGCYAYANFVSAYLYGTEGRQYPISANPITADSVRSVFSEWLDPGETIYYKTSSGGVHAIVFLGEYASGTFHDTEGDGFYFLSYAGGKDSTYDEICIGRYSYQTFASKVRYVVWHNASETYANTKKLSNISSDCPVEMIFTANGETLDSRGVDGTISNSYATMTATGSGDSRSVNVTVTEGIDDVDYSVELIGTGTGTMDLTVTYADEDGTQDVRTFKDVPVTAATSAKATGLSARCTLELYVTDGEDFSIWQANEGETTSAPTPEYTLEVDGDIPDEIISAAVPSDSTAFISIPPLAHGTIVSTALNASLGDWVTLYATPDAGYELASLTVTDVRGWPITLRDLGNGAYSFTMPNARVNVSAVFAESEAPASDAVPDVTNPADIGAWTPALVEKFPVVNTAPMPFTDVRSGDWFYDAVDYTWQRNLMTGTSDTVFDPNGTMTRAMVWTVLARLNGRETSGGSPWYQKALDYVVYNSISDGTEPNGDITRQQLVTMLWRSAGEPYMSTSSLAGFSDAEQVSEWADSAVRWAVSAGILQGDERGRLNPAATATRAEVSAILTRYCSSAA